jgi:AcrR family transcriptional regulator
MSSKRKAAPKRKAHPLVRGEPVVQGVLTAALAELARVGYGALRIEDVAARAGVNKTTVYRRWPTKPELVRAALMSMAGDKIKEPNTGTLRGDLLEIARNMLRLSCSMEGQGIFRMMLAEGPGSELLGIAHSIKENFEAVPRAVLEAAASRGEIALGADTLLLFDALAGAVHRRLFMEREKVDDALLERLVDLLLNGALSPTARAVKKPEAKRRARARS